MKKIKKLLILLLLIISAYTFKSTYKLKAQTVIYADGYILMEATTNRVLEGKNINKRYLTASICKILTAIITIENCNIEDYVLVDDKAVSMEGSKVYLILNDMVQVKDLLYGLMLRSGNDCAYLLSKKIAGSENAFAMLMNKYAKKIGMKNSTFTNSSGLDSESYNYSTPLDMAILMSYAMKNKTFKEIVNSTKYISETVENRKLYFYNKHNLVQKYDYIIGGKTGYTEKAGRTLVSYASKNNMDLVCVTFKSSNDWNEHISLFEKGYKEYSMKNVLSKGVIITNTNYKITPYLEDNIVIPLKENEKYEIKVLLLNNPQDIVGKIYVYSKSNNIYVKDINRYY